VTRWAPCAGATVTVSHAVTARTATTVEMATDLMAIDPPSVIDLMNSGNSVQAKSIQIVNISCVVTMSASSARLSQVESPSGEVS
jgi:hypothetical protein